MNQPLPHPQPIEIKGLLKAIRLNPTALCYILRENSKLYIVE